MTTAILEGIYKQGIIELLDTPSGLSEGRVRLLLIAEGSPKAVPCSLTFGKYQTGRQSTLEDFQDAEWHGDEGAEDRHG